MRYVLAFHEVLSLHNFGCDQSVHIDTRGLFISASSAFWIHEVDVVLFSQESLNLRFERMSLTLHVVALHKNQAADNIKIPMILNSNSANFHIGVEDVALTGSLICASVETIVD